MKSVGISSLKVWWNSAINPLGREHLFVGLFFFFYYCFIIHMCIQGLGHFSPLPPPPPFPPTLPPPSPPGLFFIIASNPLLVTDLLSGLYFLGSILVDYMHQVTYAFLPDFPVNLNLSFQNIP
jgi:hypothetical protein